MAATEDLVIAGSRDKRLHALDRNTGVGKWIFATTGKIDSSPVVAGNRVYFGSVDGKFYVVDLGPGSPCKRRAGKQDHGIAGGE